MDNLMWRIREAAQKLVPFVIIVAISYGGYKLYRQGAFRNGIAPAVSTVLHKIPYFGSRFQHYSAVSEGYAVAPRASVVRATHRRSSHATKHRRVVHHGRRHLRHHR